MERTQSRREFLRAASFGLTALNVGLVGCVGVQPGTGDGMTDPPRSGQSRSGRLRGLMVDAARLPEKPSYYWRVIDFCRDWKLNVLLFRLTDDQGSVLRFRNHPELITYKHALTPQEARDLAEYGERQGVTVIPEVESFGHTRYITAVPRYAYLLDSDGSDTSDSDCLNVIYPEALALISDLYREVAEIFPSPYLHGGCDEVTFGRSALSRLALTQKSLAEIWAGYLNSLDEACRGLGKELIVWGDFVVHTEPDTLPRLNKDVIVMDWQYDLTDPQPLAAAAQTVMEQGLRVIGAPAITDFRWGPRIGSQQLRNIDAFADAYLKIQDAACLGVVATNWVPSRYIQTSIWDSFAYAAVALDQGSNAAQQSAFQNFVEEFYEADWNSAWRNIFDTYYRIAPQRNLPAPGQSPNLVVPWSTEADVRAVLSSGVVEMPPYADLRAQMLAVEDSVRRNRGDFSALVLSAEYLEHIFWRQAMLMEARQQPNANLASIIASIAQRDRLLVEKLATNWDEGRFIEGKLEAIFNLEREDQLLFQMIQAARFSGELALDPERFRELLG